MDIGGPFGGSESSAVCLRILLPLSELEMRCGLPCPTISSQYAAFPQAPRDGTLRTKTFKICEWEIELSSFKVAYFTHFVAVQE